MGGVWVQRNISFILKYVFEFLLSFKVIQIYVDVVYFRRCIFFILRVVLGRFFGELAQLDVVKELCNLLINQMNMVNDVVYSVFDSSNFVGVIQSMDDVISI